MTVATTNIITELLFSQYDFVTVRYYMHDSILITAATITTDDYIK